jgi:hypothetical protein
MPNHTSTHTTQPSQASPTANLARFIKNVGHYYKAQQWLGAVNTGGSINVTSEMGRGTTFVFSLPLAL